MGQDILHVTLSGGISGSVNAVVLENRHAAQGTVHYDIAELLKLIREGKIDLDSLYSVPQEENNTEKPEEKSGKTEKQGKEEQSSAAAGSADTKKTEEGKA